MTVTQLITFISSVYMCDNKVCVCDHDWDGGRRHSLLTTAFSTPGEMLAAYLHCRHDGASAFSMSNDGVLPTKHCKATIVCA